MTDDDPNVAAELNLAHEALTAADILLTHGSTKPSIVNRLYYACFHAVRAVLYDRGHSPESHQGVLTLFGRYVVQTGDTVPEHGRFLNMMMNERRIVDYEHAPVLIDLHETYRTRRTLS